MGRAETFKRRATTGGPSDAERVSKRGREQLRWAGHSSAGQSRGEVERAVEETGRWAVAMANGLACGSRGFEAGRQRLGLQLEGYPVRGYAPGRRAREEKDSPVFVGHVAQQC